MIKLIDFLCKVRKLMFISGNADVDAIRGS